MAKEQQLKIALIPREVEHTEINQRMIDGYINATALCQASGKQLGQYTNNASTKAFLEELSSDIGIPISELVQSVKGGIPQFQGTWVHPQVAINLAQWASPKFAVLVSKWVFEWMNGNTPKETILPYHLQRYMINRSQIPPTHFSVFNEIVYNLIAPLEDLGYKLPDSMVPDISEGKMFAEWVRREKRLEPNNFPKYKHTYPDGRSFPARLYPNSLLADFRDHFNNVWLVARAPGYFKIRDTNALPYLRRVIDTLPEAKRNEAIKNFEDTTKNIKSN